MQTQLRLSDEVQKPDFSGRRIGLMARPYALHGTKRLHYFVAATKKAAMIHAVAIMDRGNYAAIKNVAGQFVISEMVSQ